MKKENSSNSRSAKILSLLMASVALSTTIAIAFLFIDKKILPVLEDGLSKSSDFIFIIPTLLAGVVGVIAISSHYKTRRFETLEKIRELEERRFLNMYSNFHGYSDDDIITDEDKAEIVAHLRESIKKEATVEFIDEIRKTFINNENKKQVISFFNDSIFRMNKHIQKLSSLSMINLTIGILVSGFAIAILYISIADLNINDTSLKNITFYTFSRMGVGIAIQLLALFFLNLYKKNIHEMKYIHNEITNIESKKTAILYSYEFSEENKISITKDLLNTERNFVLDKNQTTMSLEQAKIDYKESKDFLGIINLLLKKDKK